MHPSIFDREILNVFRRFSWKVGSVATRTATIPLDLEYLSMESKEGRNYSIIITKISKVLRNPLQVNRQNIFKFYVTGY